MRLYHKIVITLVITLAVVFLFWFMHFFAENKLKTHHATLETIDNFKTSQFQLEAETLRIINLKYPNYDLLNQQLAEHQHLLGKVGDIDAFQEDSTLEIPTTVKEIQETVLIQENLIYEFETLHSILRNSSIYIPVLAQELIFISQKQIGTKGQKLIFQIAEQIALLQNLNQPNILRNIQKLRNELQGIIKQKNLEIQKLDSFLAHTKTFQTHFVLYVTLKDKIQAQGKQIQNEIIALRKSFQKENLKNLDWIARLSYALFFFLLIAEGLILYLMIESERNTSTDKLTMLGNRLSFDQVILNTPKPTLFLINLKGFKQINNFYGAQAGDTVLEQLAYRLKSTYEPYAKVFRLGGDEFGILFREILHTNISVHADAILTLIEDEPFLYQAFPIQLSAVIGISHDEPVLQNATIILNHIKQNSRTKYMGYSSALGLEDQVSRNFKMLEEIRSAIKEDRILPVFQPIFDNKTHEIDKYECLIRIKQRDGKILSPFYFLDIARESDLYGTLTRIMIEKCFTKFETRHEEFSLNLSIEDINDPMVRQLIIKRLENSPELATRVSFELLESEGVENYDTVIEFIQEVKSFGCKIAIDDFGSGYSNYEHILKLEVDFLKIDGSLIKQIDTDKNSEMISKSIIEFAHELGIKIIVEFVHSKPVYEKVLELNADYSQGFYLGEPHFETLIP